MDVVFFVFQVHVEQCQHTKACRWSFCYPGLWLNIASSLTAGWWSFKAGEKLREETDSNREAGKMSQDTEGWCSTMLSGRWLMHHRDTAGHVHHAHLPVNWLSSANHLPHQTTRSWPDLVQNTYPSVLQRREIGEVSATPWNLRPLCLTYPWFCRNLSFLFIADHLEIKRTLFVLNFLTSVSSW